MDSRQQSLIEQSNHTIRIVTKRKDKVTSPLESVYTNAHTIPLNKAKVRRIYNIVNVIHDAYIAVLSDTSYDNSRNNMEMLKEVNAMWKDRTPARRFIDSVDGIAYTDQMKKDILSYLDFVSRETKDYVHFKEMFMPRKSRVKQHGSIVGNIAHVKKNWRTLHHDAHDALKHKMGLHKEGLISMKGAMRTGAFALGGAGLLAGAFFKSGGIAVAGGMLINRQRKKIQEDREHYSDHFKSMSKYKKQLREAVAGLRKNSHTPSRLAGGGSFRAKRRAKVLVGDNPGGVEQISVVKHGKHAVKAKTHGPELLHLNKGEQVTANPISGVGSSYVDPSSLAPADSKKEPVSKFGGGTDGSEWKQVGNRWVKTNPKPESSYTNSSTRLRNDQGQFATQAQASALTGNIEQIVASAVQKATSGLGTQNVSPMSTASPISVDPIVSAIKAQTEILKQMVDRQELYHREQMDRADDLANASKGYGKATFKDPGVAPSVTSPNHPDGVIGKAVDFVKDGIIAGVTAAAVGALGKKVGIGDAMSANKNGLFGRNDMSTGLSTGRKAMKYGISGAAGLAGGYGGYQLGDKASDAMGLAQDGTARKVVDGAAGVAGGLGTALLTNKLLGKFKFFKGGVGGPADMVDMAQKSTFASKVGATPVYVVNAAEMGGGGLGLPDLMPDAAGTSTAPKRMGGTALNVERGAASNATRISQISQEVKAAKAAGDVGKVSSLMEEARGLKTVGAGATVAKEAGFFSKIAAPLAGPMKILGKVAAPLAVAGEAISEYADPKNASLSTGQKAVKAGAAGAGTGLGMWGGAEAGAAIGAVGGPIGMAIGGLLGGALGAWGGKKLGSAVGGVVAGGPRPDAPKNGMPDATSSLTLAAADLRDATKNNKDQSAVTQQQQSPRNALQALNENTGNGAGGEGAAAPPGIMTRASDWVKTTLGVGTPSTSITAGSAQAKAREAGLQSAAQKAGITDPKELAGFMGQMSHESAGFSALKEQGSGARYEGRRDLGNTQAGDGERFKGRGFVQLTGRSNYADMTKRLQKQFPGIDLVAHPELMEREDVAQAASIEFWKKSGAGVKAKAGDVEGTSVSINGRNRSTGRANGAEDRKSRTSQYMAKFSNGIPNAGVATTGGNSQWKADVASTAPTTFAGMPKAGEGSGFDPTGWKGRQDKLKAFRAGDKSAVSLAAATYYGASLPDRINAQASVQDSTLDDNGIPKSMKPTAAPVAANMAMTASPIRNAPVPSTVPAVAAMSPTELQQAHLEQQITTQQDRQKNQDKERLEKSVQTALLQNSGGHSMQINTSNGGGNSSNSRSTITTGDDSLLAMYNLFIGQIA